MGGHGQIGYEQWTASNPAAATPTLKVRNGVAEEQVAQAVTAPLRLLRKCCEQGAMDAPRKPCCLAGPEQSCHVGKAQQPAALPADGLLQQPSSPPSTAGTGEQRCRFCRMQIGMARVIAPCEVAPTSAGQGLGLNIEAPALQDRNALLQLDVVLQG